MSLASENMLVPVKESARRVYVVYNPSRSVHDVLSYHEETCVIQDMILEGKYHALFADRAFTMQNLATVRADDKLHWQAETQLSWLFEDFFSEVWFYGTGVSEFTMLVANVAFHKRISVVDYSQRHSLLNRYLENWILGLHILPH